MRTCSTRTCSTRTRSANTCSVNTCSVNSCGANNARAGTELTSQTPDDCQQAQCDGSGGSANVPRLCGRPASASQQ